MEQMLAIAAGDSSAALAGFVGMTCLAAWPLFRTRSVMLAVYLGNNLGFGLHYALLDHWTAVAMNGLMAVQTVAAIGLVRYPRLKLAYFAIVPLMVCATISTWQGLPSSLAAAATALSIAGRMQGNETFLRGLLLASTPFWATHDLLVGSLPGLIADVISMAIGTVMLLRRLLLVAPDRGAGSAAAPVRVVTSDRNGHLTWFPTKGREL